MSQVTFSAPVPGLVIRYSYLWHREALQGRDEGQKDRPCAIVAAVKAVQGGKVRVVVLPVTHSQPAEAGSAVEIPESVKRQLGLDKDRCWVMASEWNEFLWPGPDLRRLPGADDRSIAYGIIAPKFFGLLRAKFVANVQAGMAKAVRRTE